MNSAASKFTGYFHMSLGSLSGMLNLDTVRQGEY